MLASLREPRWIYLFSPPQTIFNSHPVLTLFTRSRAAIRRVDQPSRRTAVVDKQHAPCLFPRRTVRRCTNTSSGVRTLNPNALSKPLRTQKNVKYNGKQKKLNALRLWLSLFHLVLSLLPLSPRVVRASTEGVIYAKKDFNLPAHPEIKEVPNLQVRRARKTTGICCFQRHTTREMEGGKKFRLLTS